MSLETFTQNPRQNRVTPFGSIIATPARGLLMGNRGCLHDAEGRIRRAFVTQRWIICRLDFKNVRRPLMTPGRWTELFFLDEATALAAGHRPCAYCQRARFNCFRTLWAAANPALAGSPTPAAPVIDAVLHGERITVAGQKVTYAGRFGELPTGVFVVLEPVGQPYLVWGSALLPWQPAGYGAPIARVSDAIVQVLTPQSVVRTLARGYSPLLHPSAQMLNAGSPFACSGAIDFGAASSG